MARTAKTWSDKMAKPPAPEVLVLEKAYTARHPAGTRMLISTPREIAAFGEGYPGGDVRVGGGDARRAGL
jgi:hypothetical protein